MADNSHAVIEKELLRIERRIKRIYSQVGKEIQAEWDTYFKERKTELDAIRKEYREALANADSLKSREALRKMQKAERELLMLNRYYQGMVDNTTEHILQATTTAIAYVNDELPSIYAIAYNGTGKGITEAYKGFQFEMLNQYTVRDLVTAKQLLLPAKKLNPRKDKRWNTARINAEMTKGILRGESMQKIARRLRNVSDMSGASAIRNARTMVTSAENLGRVDQMYKASELGIIIDKQWIATHDGRVRDAHAELDRVIVGVNDDFENEYGRIAYPGDPTANPANVYNCRCTLVSVYRGMKV